MSLDQHIEIYLAEDVGDGDHTTLACIPENAKSKAQLLIKENGILAGVEIAKRIFQRLDKNVKIDVFLTDGAKIKNGDIVFIVEGNTRSILTAERLVLNIIQRMSGIATMTNKFVEAIKHTKAKIVDTRKTTPGFRYFEKLAVKIGGGENHRMGLYDMILIKDNHIDIAGGIKQVILSTNKYLKDNAYRLCVGLKIEIEARNLDDVKTILSVGGVHRIMFDNFTIADTKKAIKLVQGQYETESSGGITLANVRAYAECGVDFISVGSLTHHIKSLDMSLKTVINRQ